MTRQELEELLANTHYGYREEIDIYLFILEKAQKLSEDIDHPIEQSITYYAAAYLPIESDYLCDTEYDCFADPTKIKIYFKKLIELRSDFRSGKYKLIE